MAEIHHFKRLWLRYLWLLPLVAGASWFLTLSILLIHWLAVGRPTYPGQSNPYVAFVSDIAAFEFKPVFIAGCTTTAITFALTVWAVHCSRYSAHSYGLTDDAKWKKTTSMLALFCGLWASVSFLLLAIFDTYRAHERHQYLLFSCFGGLGWRCCLLPLFGSTRPGSSRSGRVFGDGVWRVIPGSSLR